MDQKKQERFFENHLAGVIILSSYITLFSLDLLFGGH